MGLYDSFELPSGVKLKNPLIFAPISLMESSTTGSVTEDELSFYALRTGDVGAIVIASAYISPFGKSFGNGLSVSHDRYIKRLRKLSSTIQKNETKAILQIYHGGAMAEKQMTYQEIYCVSQDSKRLNQEMTYHELTDKQIKQIIQEYEEAVVRSIKADFDGVEIHAANSYLPNQFLMPKWNLRTDDWGGTLTKRLKFLKEVLTGSLKAINEHKNKPFALGVRISLEDILLTSDIEKENSLKETIAVLKELDDLGLDYIHINSSNALKEVKLNGHFLDLLKVLKKVVVKTPLVGCGNILQPNEVLEVLDKTELVSACRPFIFIPNWGQKIINKEQVLLPNQVLDGKLRQTYQIPKNLWKAIMASPDWYLYK